MLGAGEARLNTAGDFPTWEARRQGYPFIRAQTHEEAEGMVHAFQKMRSIGYDLVNVSLHYKGNQGLDMIFRTADGQMALVTSPTYAVVEAKHGKGPESVSTDRKKLEQGSPEYNEDRLREYLKSGDKTQVELAKHLLRMSRLKQLKSYAAFYKGNSLYELTPKGDGKQTNKVRIK